MTSTTGNTSQPVTPVRVATTFGFRLGSAVYLAYLVLMSIGLLVYLLADYFLPFGTSESLATYLGTWIVFTFVGLFRGGLMAYSFATLFVVIGVDVFWAIIARFQSPPTPIYSTLLGGIVFFILELPVGWLVQRWLLSPLYFWLFAGFPCLLYVAIGIWTGFRLPRYSRDFLAWYSLNREIFEKQEAETRGQKASRPKPNHPKNTRTSLVIISVIGFGLIVILNSVEWVLVFGFMMLMEYGVLYAMVHRIPEVNAQTKRWFAILVPLAVIGSILKIAWLVAR